MSERSETGGEIQEVLEQEARLDRTLRAAILEERQEAQAQGWHPDPEELLAYQEDQLSVERREDVADHLSLCPECTRLVLDLADFEETEGSDQVAEPERATEDPRPFQPPARTEQKMRPPRRVSSPLGWAAAVALLALGMAVVLFLPRGAESPVHVGWIYLSPEGTTRGEGQELELAPSVRHVTLILGEAWTGDFRGYRVEILTPDGSETWATEGVSQAPDGTVSVSVPLEELPNGAFEVQLSGRTGDGWQALGRYAVNRPAS